MNTRRRIAVPLTIAIVTAVFHVAVAANAAADEIARPVLSRIEVRDMRLVTKSGATSIVAEVEVFAYRAYITRDNARGYVSESAEQRARVLLAKHDADGDDALDLSEFRAIPALRTQTAAVASKIGRDYAIEDLDVGEEGVAELLQLLDSNRDGLLVERELARFDLATRPVGFKRANLDLTIAVSLEFDASQRPVDERRFRVDPDTQRITVVFGPYKDVPLARLKAHETWQRLLPGVYTVTAVLNVAVQSAKHRAQLWHDAVIQVANHQCFVRASADDLWPGQPIPSAHRDIGKKCLRDKRQVVVAGYSNETRDAPYSWGDMSALQDARDALAFHAIDFHGYDHLLKRIDDAIEEPPNAAAAALYLAKKAELLLLLDIKTPRRADGSAWAYTAARGEFDDLVAQLHPLYEYVDWWRYYRKLEYRGLRERIDSLFLDLWWKTKLCTPEFEPTGLRSDGTARTLQSERHRWFRNPPAEEDGTGGGERLLFLSCSDLQPHCRGSWDRDLWLTWLGAERRPGGAWRFRTDGTAPANTWLEQVVEVEAEFCRLYGLKQGDCETGEPLDDDAGGRMVTLRDNRCTPNCVEVLWPLAYQLAYDAVLTLRKVAMAYANRLCKDHAMEGDDVEFAFCAFDLLLRPDRSKEHKDGRVSDALRYYILLCNNPKAFYDSLDLYALTPPTGGSGLFERPHDVGPDREPLMDPWPPEKEDGEDDD